MPAKAAYTATPVADWYPISPYARQQPGDARDEWSAGHACDYGRRHLSLLGEPSGNKANAAQLEKVVSQISEKFDCQ